MADLQMRQLIWRVEVKYDVKVESTFRLVAMGWHAFRDFISSLPF